MTLNFPKLYEWQKPLFEDVINCLKNPDNETFVVCSPRQCGKNFTVQLILVYTALLKKETTSIMIEPTFNQARKVYKQLFKTLNKNNLVQSASGATFDIVLKNGSEINLRSAQQKENLRGLTVSGIMIIDECAYIDSDIFDIVYPFVNVHRAPKILISTPAAKFGKFYEEFTNLDNNRYLWSRTSYDMSMVLSEKLIKKYQKSMTPQKFKTEILGEFLDAESDVFGDFSSCIYKGMLSDNQPVCAGIDWGTGQNGDSTVLTLMNKSKEVTYLYETNSISPTEQIEKLSQIINKYNSLECVTVETNSIGTIYMDSLRSKLTNKNILKGFNTNNNSKRDAVEYLALLFQNKEIKIPNNQMLINQLNAFVIKSTPSGKITYENNLDSSKDDMVDSLWLCSWHFKTKALPSFGFVS